MKKLSVLLMVFIFFHGCKPAPGVEQQDTDPPTVKVTVAAMKDFQDRISASGILMTRKEMKLSFKTGGIIKSIGVKEGDVVREGEVLAALDLSEINAKVRQAKVARDKAYRDLVRAKNLYNDSVVTLETYQNARSAYELARAQDQIAEFNLKYSYIKAPANGKVLKILVERSEMIAPGYPAILFASTDNDWVVRISLADRDIVRMEPGDSAVVTMDAFPGKKFNAEVSELAALSDPVTGTYSADILVKDVMTGFRTGYIARTIIYPDSLRKSLWLPFGALMDMRNDTGYVFVVSDNVAETRRIVTGPFYQEGMLIREGILEGDTVVISGMNNIADGDTVHIQP